MKNSLFRLLSVALLAAAILSSSGCYNTGAWKNGEPENVKTAHVGWTVNQVAVKVGKPIDMIEYNGLRLGWEEWVYPTGSIFFYRLVVKDIVSRSKGTPPPRRSSDNVVWPVEMKDPGENYKPKGDFGDF
ncbi:MAG: hypothetical protein JXR97_11110 [Planctomycetes bacterium]|nr:hypothetical protein [Planctomycetota bacterium]